MIGFLRESKLVPIIEAPLQTLDVKDVLEAPPPPHSRHLFKFLKTFFNSFTVKTVKIRGL
jgi:hypothetical protein